MELDEILQRLKNVKHVGGGEYKACCPVHNDKEPSLHITQKEDKILMHCKALCRPEDICDALGIKMSDLFIKKGDKEKMVIKEREHMYVDENGKPTMKKTIKKMSDGSKNAYWHLIKDKVLISGLGGQKAPLYNLKSVKEETDTIYIVEGEKDADTLIKMGFTATTSPNGAGAKWRDEYNTHLKGKNLIIIKDNDDAGTNHAIAIQNALLNQAKTIKIIDPLKLLPSLHRKGDISDIVEKLGLNETKSKLEQVISITPIITKKAEEIKDKANKLPIWLKEKTNKKGYKILSPIFADWFAKKYKLCCVNESFYSADGEIQNSEVKSNIYKELKPYFEEDLKEYWVRDLFGVLKFEAHLDPPEPSEHRIFCKNKVLIWDKDGNINEEDNSDYFTFNRLNVTYNKEQQPPKTFLKLVDDMLEETDIKTLQEYLGYCLIPTTKAQKALFIIGKGEEGKSKLIYAMEEIFKNSCIHNKLHEIENNRFAVARMENKLLFVDDDLQSQKLTSTGIFKTLVTNECTIETEKKGVDSRPTRIYTRFLCVGNQSIGSCFDHSDGFYRRLIILNCKPKTRAKDDVDIKKKLKKEKDAIFNWCLDGLQRLIRNEWEFTISERTRENLEELKKEENNIISFMESEGYITFGKDRETTTADLYYTYQKWCNDNNIGIKEIKNTRTFSAYLKSNQEEYKIKYDKNISNNYNQKKVRGYRGIHSHYTNTESDYKYNH